MEVRFSMTDAKVVRQSCGSTPTLLHGAVRRQTKRVMSVILTSVKTA